MIGPLLGTWVGQHMRRPRPAAYAMCRVGIDIRATPLATLLILIWDQDCSNYHFWGVSTSVGTLVESYQLVIMHSAEIVGHDYHFDLGLDLFWSRNVGYHFDIQFDIIGLIVLCWGWS